MFAYIILHVHLIYHFLNIEEHECVEYWTISKVLGNGWKFKHIILYQQIHLM